MKLFYFLPLLSPLASAGNVCLSRGTALSAIGGNPQSFQFFAAGSPCEVGQKSLEINPKTEELCDILPKGVRICDKSGNLVKAEGEGAVDNAGGCGINLEIDGKRYKGRRLNGGTDRPCDGSCTSGVGGLFFSRVIFENVPMCD
ncbi:hypothetical protein AJ79_02427 [Helicocarpus griseus UAMH5409]|uniref:Uncharacterized protein n=1 Tax=Helicocarpus griseus UAMH5409 TaxID=1447875 RepID=A0A2B7Y2F3_9EURO|nr:hypothetical protein AJ79_02427 [Helicocarpus griseus UAMH5409]